MHGDREYLSFLQESTFKNRSFISKEANGLVEMTQDELKEELGDMFDENETVLGEVLSELDVGQAFGSVVMRLTQGEAAVGGAVAAAAILALATKMIGKASSHPECKKYSGGSMKKCNQIVNAKKKMGALKAKIGLCGNSKDPGTCKTKVQAKINAEAEKIKNLGKIEGVG